MNAERDGRGRPLSIGISMNMPLSSIPLIPQAKHAYGLVQVPIAVVGSTLSLMKSNLHCLVLLFGARSNVDWEWAWILMRIRAKGVELV